MLEAFRLGGFGMWPTLAFGLTFVFVALRYAAGPEKRLVPLLASLGLLTLVSGAFGFVAGLIATTRFLGGVEAGSQVAVFFTGFGESLHNVALALLALVVGALATTVGAFRSARG